MPYDVTSPLAAGMAAAASVFKAKQQREQQEQQSTMDVQRLANQTALTQAQVDNYKSQGNYRQIQGQQILEKVANMPREAAMRYIKTMADAGYIDEKTRQIAEGSIPLERAQAGLDVARTGQAQAETAYTRGPKTDLAEANVYNIRYERPREFNQKIASAQQMNQQRIGAAAGRQQATIAASFQREGMREEAARDMATITLNRMLMGEDYRAAVEGAKSVYSEGMSNYRQQVGLAALKPAPAAGDPTPAPPQMPQFIMPPMPAAPNLTVIMTPQGPQVMVLPPNAGQPAQPRRDLSQHPDVTRSIPAAKPKWLQAISMRQPDVRYYQGHTYHRSPSGQWVLQDSSPGSESALPTLPGQ
ncbi:MAG: hypothetical protein GIX02_04485 [Candidatus Eremiobacteraeota bacterium]|nr:hypothetical protein [Candidatus Eremiobacteraeota bacterium]